MFISIKQKKKIKKKSTDFIDKPDIIRLNRVFERRKIKNGLFLLRSI